MSSAITLGLGLLGAGLGGRVLWQAYRGGARAGADKWARGGFQVKMDRSEAMKILGVKWVPLPFPASLLPRLIPFRRRLGTR
jgi:DnaJ family protein C protein 19